MRNRSQLNNIEIVRQSAAHHEAGHCVVGLQLGLRVNRVTLAVKPRMLRDPLVDGLADIGDDDSDPAAMAAVAAGGPAAEAWWNHIALGADFDHCHQWTQASNREDAAVLAGYARAARVNQRHIVGQAASLVAANWPVVATIAATLLMRGSLSRREICRLAAAGT